jgi:hypothetical protein
MIPTPLQQYHEKDWKNFALEHLRNAIMDRMRACIQSFFLERKQNWHAFVLLQRNKSFRIGSYKQQSLRCVFVTVKNFIHDEKDLAQARSLSLSLSLSLNTICLRVS